MREESVARLKRRVSEMPVQHRKIRVLFVCLGNICRSPTAEGVFRQLVKEAGLANTIEVDSAGTGDYHIGERPDPRACWAASRRGYDLTPLRARQVTRRDFEQFDYVLAMDEQNLRALKQLAPEEQAHKLKMLTDFCSNGECTVPDPYAGGPQGFEFVLDLVEDAAQGLLRQIGTRTEV
ncbi:MAG: low molecular weight phosphotyrosine protein phosphatase [Betaproteobacteria bacterium]|jgi:protein-tyrosine phosphatase|nr:low molecular weight phosphotyrosine protein phosphatase [Betaproteobacteria bacterium]MEA3154451.1 low molecular weight protein-tyrosine phosphatase [Betaproteobacteria bacterium]